MQRGGTPPCNRGLISHGGAALVPPLVTMCSKLKLRFHAEQWTKLLWLEKYIYYTLSNHCDVPWIVFERVYFESLTLFSVLTFHVSLMTQIKLFSPNKFCEMDTWQLILLMVAGGGKERSAMHSSSRSFYAYRQTRQFRAYLGWNLALTR